MGTYRRSTPSRRRRCDRSTSATKERKQKQKQQQQQGPRRSKEWGAELARAAAAGGAEARAKVSSRMDASDEVWADMYQVGLWGFGRLSFSAPVVAGGGGDSETDGGDAAPE